MQPGFACENDVLIARLQGPVAAAPVQSENGFGGKSGLPFTDSPRVGTERTWSGNGAPDIK
jgi:hypothetical protein